MVPMVCADLNRVTMRAVRDARRGVVSVWIILEVISSLASHKLTLTFRVLPHENFTAVLSV